MKYLKRHITLLILIFISINIQGQVFTKTYVQGDSITGQGNRYITWDILFAFDKADLNKEKQPIVLDSLVNFLIKNDSIVLEVSVHRDSRGNEQMYSRNLSQSRALAIVKYLIEKGVDPKRLVAKGYGTTRLLIPDSEIAKTKDKELIELMHQKNRRVEFIVLRKDYKAGQ